VLEERDALTVTYRGHGWVLGRGVPAAHLFAELMGRRSPLCGGRGGSAYLSSAAHGLLGENSIVGAGVPIAAGAALAAKHTGDGSISLVSIGDGAMNQGGVHEALNFAAVYRLPLVVVVENNVYSELTPISAMCADALRASPLWIDARTVDSCDPAVRDAAAGSRDAREGRAGLLECRTALSATQPRHRAHRSKEDRPRRRAGAARAPARDADRAGRQPRRRARGARPRARAAKTPRTDLVRAMSGPTRPGEDAPVHGAVRLRRGSRGGCASDRADLPEGRQRGPADGAG
jgi:TPP-dependent pyruvate/acetoin dehydrogenase alpha subunit